MVSESVDVGLNSIPPANAAAAAHTASSLSPAPDASRKASIVDEPTARPPPRKRRRLVISCTECHRRKQKCNRGQPCDNCISRKKEDACEYQTGVPAAKHDDDQQARKKNGARSPTDGEQNRADAESLVGSIPSKVANFGYSQTGASSLGLLKKIEGANPEEPLSRLNPDTGQPADHVNIRDRYKTLIRQLPARSYLDQLVERFFVDFNWQYAGLDRDVFDKQLAQWHNLPYNVLTHGGPHALPPDLRAFPALLFQVLASALLVSPADTDTDLESLKYNDNMTFEDLALDYSESGVAILSLLGKRNMSLTTVLAGFLRASFLKYAALVTEAWHAIGVAIRDAQEIGLHRDSLDPKPASDDAEAVLENQWEIQRRRKIWMILLGWDLHTGIVLGRPTTHDINKNPPTLPVDAPIPKDRSKTPVVPRSENDPPTPITRAIWSYRVMAPLRDILDLEKEGPCPKDFSKVDKLHQDLLELEARTPPYFRLENPDTRFDNLPECFWIPYVRASVPQLISFNLMALHRPYIFTRTKSRTEALKACLSMLNAQRLHFQSLRPPQYKTFSLFFGTFDAIVLMASIYILFPKEHPELVQNAIQHFQFAVERFQAMSTRNALAKAALGVLHAIYMRLKKSLGITCHAAGLIKMLPAPLPLPFADSPKSAWTTSGSTNGSSNGNNTVLTEPSPPQSLSDNCTSGSRSTGTSISGSSGASHVNNALFSPPIGGESVYPPPPPPAPHQQQEQQQPDPGFDWNNLPSDFDWASLQPIYATGDLVYNDLVSSARDDPGLMMQWDGFAGGAGAGAGLGPATDFMNGNGAASRGGVGETGTEQPWQFEGDFGNDSVWNLLNQYVP